MLRTLSLPLAGALCVLSACTTTTAGHPVASDSPGPSVAGDGGRALSFRKVLDSQPAGAPPGAASGTARQDPALVTGSGDGMAAASTAQQALAGLTCATPDPLHGTDDPNRPLLACDQDGTTKYLLGPVFLRGTEIDRAVASPPTPNKPGWTVDLTFKSAGRQIWADFTSKSVGQQAAFVVDTQVLSAPTVQNAIVDGNTQISGNFTQQQVQQLVAEITGR